MIRQLSRLFLLQVFLNAGLAFADEAPVTFILVDNSATMNEQLDQDEAWGDLNHYVNNLAAADLLSLSYFGGDNGGDCESPVEISAPGPKEELALERAPGSAFGDNPLLGALDSIESASLISNARIVVVSDFDAVCGSTHSTCMAVRGYEARYPDLDFDFEPIGDQGKNTELYNCLVSTLDTNKSWLTSRIQVDFNLTTSQPPAVTGAELNQFVSTLGWLFYLILSGSFLGMLALEIAKFQYMTSEVENSVDLTGQTTQISEQRHKLTEEAIRWRLATGYSAVLWTVFFYSSPSEMEQIFKRVLGFSNTRFGSEILSTLFGGYAVWFAFSLWKGGLTRLSADWRTNFDTLKKETNAAALRKIISELEVSLGEELSRRSDEFGKYREMLDADEISKGEALFDALKSAFGDTKVIVESSLNEDNLKKWKPHSFRQANKIVEQLQDSYSLDREKAKLLKLAFSRWKNFETQLPKLTRNGRQDNEGTNES